MLPTLAAAVVVAVLPEPLAAEAFEEAELAALDAPLALLEAALDAALALLEATLDALEAALDSAEERALDPDASMLETADETDATMDEETSGGTLPEMLEVTAAVPVVPGGGAGPAAVVPGPVAAVVPVPAAAVVSAGGGTMTVLTLSENVTVAPVAV